SKPDTRPLQCQSCSTFVNCAWLAENLQDVSLLCCRPRPDYLDGHIPGAVHCSWQEVSGGGL
ncbi:rhodanese-related sulfurtransferase, partial [Haematococcus lacustris]